MQESLSQISKSAAPVTLNLSPRDLFTLHIACEAAVLNMTECGFDDNELRVRMEDLEQRFRSLLSAGGRP